MKRSIWLTVVAGALVFLFILVLSLPAAWITPLLPAQVECRQPAGSIWRGECATLVVRGGTLGAATWDVAAGAALTGTLRGTASLTGSALQARADFDSSFAGVGELRQVTARFDLDPELLPQLPPEHRGRLSANFDRMVLGPGRQPQVLLGTIELRDLVQTGPQPLELGSYQVSFDGKSTEGRIVGQLRDLGGPFAVQGTVTLSPPDGYVVQGFITGRTAQAERIVREITLGATPDNSGRSAFSFEGTY
jgi:hypothetical protein